MFIFTISLFSVAYAVVLVLIATSVNDVDGGRMGHIVITTLRQESDFVVEWLNYNRWIGFDHVVIYDQDDDQTLLPLLLGAYVDAGAITIVPWTLIGDQQGAISHGLRTYGRHAKSVSLLDGDEFMVLCKHASVGEAFEAARIFDKKYGCFDVLWLPFGPSGRLDKPGSGVGVLETFTDRAREPFHAHPGKVVLRGGRSFVFTRMDGPLLKSAALGRVFDSPYWPPWHSCRNRWDFRRYALLSWRAPRSFRWRTRE
jgi:hypothetical protein